MKGIYAPPVGNKAVLMVDTRDLGEVSARALLRRQHAGEPLPRRTLDVVSPETLTGEGIASIWSELLGGSVAYGGDDLDAFEAGMRSAMPPWMTYDMRLMMRSFQTRGMTVTPGYDDELQTRLGRPMRTYRDFARETAESWKT